MASNSGTIDMGSVLKVMKAGKATKNTLASFESLNALLKASDSGAATQIKPHAHELVEIYVALISRHAETKKMCVCTRPHSSSLLRALNSTHRNKGPR